MYTAQQALQNQKKTFEKAIEAYLMNEESPVLIVNKNHPGYVFRVIAEERYSENSKRSTSL